MQIAINQINQTQLNAFIANSISGGTWSGIAIQYFASSGWVGPNVLYVSGSDQQILGIKTFLTNPELQYGGTTGSAISRGESLNLVTGSILSFSGYTDGQVVHRQGTERIYGVKTLLSSILSFSGYTDGQVVHRQGTESISGDKTFLTSINVPVPTIVTQAANMGYVSGVSGVLQSAIDTVSVANVVYQSGNQIISGVKTFISSPLVPTPTDASGAVPLSYLSTLNLTGVAYVNSSNTFTAANTFTNTVTIPIGVASTSPVTVAQLNAAVIGATNTGSANVTSVNGISGSVFIDGQGTVTIYECSGIIYASGAVANNTQLYSAKIPIASGATGLQFIFGTGYNYVVTPTVVGNLEYTGSSNIAFIRNTPYGVTTTGFNVAFESGVPNFYLYDVNVIPFASGNSGFLGIQGAMGRNGSSPNARGQWQAGLFFNPLDYVFTSPLFTSYICTSGHVSTLSNQPTSTGNAGLWQIFSSGATGPTGFSIFQGEYNTGTVYQYNYSTTLNGSTYGFTGTSIQNVSPDSLTGGFFLMARKGDIGSQTFNSGSYVTGSYSTVSFYCSPVLTGLAVAEAGVGANFNLTGIFLGARVSGSGPAIGANGILSGNVYVVSLTNVETNIINFTFNSGVYGTYTNGLAIPITGGYRIGVNITNVLSGIDKFSINCAGINGIS